jgi:hypothetical protein
MLFGVPACAGMTNTLEWVAPAASGDDALLMIAVIPAMTA